MACQRVRRPGRRWWLVTITGTKADLCCSLGPACRAEPARSADTRAGAAVGPGAAPVRQGRCRRPGLCSVSRQKLGVALRVRFWARRATGTSRYCRPTGSNSGSNRMRATGWEPVDGSSTRRVSCLGRGGPDPPGARSGPAQDSAMSLSFFRGRTLTTVFAGLALKVVSSPVKGFVPLRAFVAGFFWVVIFINPGRVNCPAPRFLM